MDDYCGTHHRLGRADADELAISKRPALGLFCGCEPPSRDLQAYLRAHASSLVNYAERYRRGERISTAISLNRGSIG